MQHATTQPHAQSPDVPRAMAPATHTATSSARNDQQPTLDTLDPGATALRDGATGLGTGLAEVFGSHGDRVANQNSLDDAFGGEAHAGGTRASALTANPDGTLDTEHGKLDLTGVPTTGVKMLYYDQSAAEELALAKQKATVLDGMEAFIESPDTIASEVGQNLNAETSEAAQNIQLSGNELSNANMLLTLAQDRLMEARSKLVGAVDACSRSTRKLVAARLRSKAQAVIETTDDALNVVKGALGIGAGVWAANPFAFAAGLVEVRKSVEGLAGSRPGRQLAQEAAALEQDALDDDLRAAVTGSQEALGALGQAGAIASAAASNAAKIEQVHQQQRERAEGKFDEANKANPDARFSFEGTRVKARACEHVLQITVQANDAARAAIHIARRVADNDDATPETRATAERIAAANEARRGELTPILTRASSLLAAFEHMRAVGDDAMINTKPTR